MEQIKGQQIHVTKGKSTWIKVDIKKVASHWFRYPKDNLGLVLHSYDTEGRELTIGRACSGTPEDDLQVGICITGIGHRVPIAQTQGLLTCSLKLVTDDITLSRPPT